MGKISDERGGMFQDKKKAIDGRGLRVAEIVKMLPTVTSVQPTFMCIICVKLVSSKIAEGKITLVFDHGHISLLANGRLVYSSKVSIMAYGNRIYQ